MDEKVKYSRSTLALTIAQVGTMLNAVHVGAPTVEQTRDVCRDGGLPIPAWPMEELAKHPLILAAQLAAKPDVGYFHAAGAFENAVDHMRKFGSLDA